MRGGGEEKVPGEVLEGVPGEVLGEVLGERRVVTGETEGGSPTLREGRGIPRLGAHLGDMTGEAGACQGEGLMTGGTGEAQAGGGMRRMREG